MKKRCLMWLIVFLASNALASDCIQRCDKSKSQCMLQYTKSDAKSGRYVTPEGHKTCWSAYHECKKNCPKPIKK